jgi:hypothetical protein
MLLVLSLVLALIPLLGIVLIAMLGTLTTVDGLFMSLILLSISGIFGLNALLELRSKKGGAGRAKATALTAGKPVAMSDGTARESGRVESVVFYESHVGVQNTSIVTLSDDNGGSRLLVVNGDARNSLPVGKKARITYRSEEGRKTLLAVDYN